MARYAPLLMLGSLAVVSLVAQSPAGWLMRIDRSASVSDPDAPGAVKFVAQGGGFHATNPQAAVFWNPANTTSGAYSVKGTFTLVTPSNHANYYGLLFGGRNLDGGSQQYLYFLVAQDGTWLVKRRDGDSTTESLLPKTPSAAIRKPDGGGRSVNDLEVRIASADIEFVVNGTVVNRWRGAGRAVRTGGIYGIRINHFLEVQVDGLTSAAPARTTTTSIAETVAVTAPVGRMLSPSAFSIKEDGKDVLVLAAALQRPVEANTSVTVFGEPFEFDPDAMARKVRDGKPAVPPDVAAAYRGHPAVLATAVLTEKMVDLTKRLAPPATPDEEALDKVMKRVAPAFEALRQAVDRSNAAGTAENARLLDAAFGETEAFWTAKARTDAASWAREARSLSEVIQRQSTAGGWDGVKTLVDALGQQCQSCHAAYREQFADGAFRIKNR